jgi:hypothetical protein
MSRKAMQVALEALESDPISHTGLVTVLSPGKGTGFNYARASQKTAVSPDGGTGFIDGVWYGPEPPKKEWVELTDEEIQDLSYLSQKIDQSNAAWFDRWGFARAIEQALKEKNT